MNDLARDRPIFHSEADFQHALAWRIHDAMPDGRVRLEYKPFPLERKRMHLDIWFPDIGVAMELKYSTRNFNYEHDGEYFALKTGAQDLARYGFLKDIQRLERLSELPVTRAGFAILLTNDPDCWNHPLKPTAASYAFRLREGRKVKGKMTVPADAGPGAIMGMEEPICLKNSYELRWKDYADLGNEADGGKFRYIAVQTAY